MVRMLPRQATALIVASARVTHDSEISAAGALFVATLISDLVLGVLPRTAVSAAIRTLRSTAGTHPLITKLDLALQLRGDTTIAEARKFFGTGSPIQQTLPLAVFCFLSSADDFRQSVLSAANSFRVDDQSEHERLAQLPKEAAMQQAKGGNTDGVAALAGAFAGAFLGFNAIPADFRNVESAEVLRRTATALVSAQVGAIDPPQAQEPASGAEALAHINANRRRAAPRPR